MFGLNDLAAMSIDDFLRQGIVSSCEARGYEVDAESVASVLLTRWSSRRARRIVIEQFAGRRGCSFKDAVEILNESPEARGELEVMEVDWDEMFGFLLQLLTLLIKLM